MRKINFIRIAGIALLLFFPWEMHATHNRAGEITYRLISGYTFEVTITTYTYSLSQANRSELTIQWGDNTSSVVPLTTRILLPDYYYKNTYVARHTFPGPGVYTLLMEDPNRNEGIKNIPNSVNVVFSIKSTLSINPVVGVNNTPLLTNPPIDKAAVGIPFVHNPGAYDPDGDSLSYKLSVCTAEGGNAIVNYSLPKYSDSLVVNPRTGDFIWASPMEAGNYNVAILIEEWRKGVKIGSVVRDMQITVINTNNRPPVNPFLPDRCIVAGNSLSFSFTVTDPDNNMVYVSASGAPFESPQLTSKASLEVLSQTAGATTARFTWNTNCSCIRKLPWNVLIKAKDSVVTLLNNGITVDTLTQSLADMDNFAIRVVAPPPVLQKVYEVNNVAYLSWSPSACPQVKGYEVYRRQDYFSYQADSCNGGVPSGTGYVLAGTVASAKDTTFIDDNKGAGLLQGANYCYVVVAYYEDGSLSLPSNEKCVTVKPGMPALLNVSVIRDGETDGVIYLAWVKPRVDTFPGVTGPYTYRIYRSDFSLTGEGMRQIASFTTSDLNDTVFYDTLNTLQFPYAYRVELYDGQNHKIGEKQELASSLYPSIRADNRKLFLSMEKNTPWTNLLYVVYRKNALTGLYDSIGTTHTTLFVDSNLVNGNTYCYRIKSIGVRTLDSTVYSTINYSHIHCGIPQDTIPPCQPPVRLFSHCDSFYIQVVWTKPACAADAVKYHIYYAPDLSSTPSLIYTVNDPSVTSYLHFLENVKGCYYVTAIDSFNNESPVSQKFCSDECYEYSLPNFFTPNGDNINDFFEPIHKTFVKKIDIKIYNRWGLLVYETTDPDIHWDGRYIKNGQPLPAGTYYYICTVYEDRLSGEQVRTLYGFVMLYYDRLENQPSKE